MKTRHGRGLYAPELLEARIAPATFIVTNLADDGTDGTLRNEIADANAAPGADTITFAPALFAGGVPGIVTLVGGVEIPITDTLTIKGPGIDLLSVSGAGASRIFNIDDGTAALKPTTISGLTLSGGNSTTNGGAIFSFEPLALKNVVIRSSYAQINGGGAFVSTAGKISITGSSIVHNLAGTNGGGLYLRSVAGISIVKTTISQNVADNHGGLYAGVTGMKALLLIDSCIISNNLATSGVAGGLKLNGASDVKIIVKNSLVTGNSAPVAGGGLFLNNGNLLITKTTFSQNTAGRGGAIADEQATSLTISGSRFIGNSATDNSGVGGGALYLKGSTAVLITKTIFAGNTSESAGGAISHQGALTLGITGSSFFRNTASGGGAIFLTDGAVLTMKSSELSGNTATTGGGALAGSGGAALNLISNKLTENRSMFGGAIFIAETAGAGATANLIGNLLQANVADSSGGAVAAAGASSFNSTKDRFIGNVALADQGGGVFIDNTGGNIISGSLFQGNHSAGSGGGILLSADATLTGIKVLENIAGTVARGGGLRISAGAVIISKSVVTGNVASDGGGIFYNVGTTTLDAATRAATKGNAAMFSPNIGSA